MKKIPLTQNKYAIVDNEDFEELSKYKWYAYTDGFNFYAGRKLNKKIYRMHTMIMNTPKGMHTDHINGDSLDNRKSNLRICTPSQNKMNSKMYKTNKSGFKGVYFYKQTNKWKAQIQINKKRVSLGYFSTSELASKAYEKAAEEHYKEYTRK